MPQVQKIFDHMKWFDPAARFALLLWAGVSLYRQSGLLLALVLLLILLDVGRLALKPVVLHPAAFSVLSIVLCVAILSTRRVDLMQVYYFFLLDEIFKAERGRRQNGLIAVHFAGFMAAECYGLFVTESRGLAQDFLVVLFMLGTYALLLFIFAIIHYYKWDRDKIKELNARLIEYSFQEREYLVANERSHISQELHDSLGHSLMAALMNVRYLKAIPDKSPEEKSRQINEIENLLKDCVKNLRGSVCSLKELDENIRLREEIEHILHNFDDLGLVSIRLDYDDRIDEAPNSVRSVLYKTIREGITNSIRHGNATEIRISVRPDGGRIALLVADNGSGCADIQKSFGLNGITDRVKEAGGEVWFISAKNKGFTIKASLPGGMES